MRKIIVFAVLLLWGCSTGDIVSIKNRRPKGYKSLVVLFDVADEGIALKIETKIAKKIKSDNVTCIPSSLLLARGKNYTKMEIKKIFSQNNIDAILGIKITNADVEKEFVPARYYKGADGTAQYEGAKIKSTPYIKYTAKLIDAEEEQVVWTGHGSSKEFYAGFWPINIIIKSDTFDLVLSKMASDIVGQLRDDKVIP